MKLPDDIDQECRSLCEAMNALPGIRTTESCCGHGKAPFRVFFFAQSLDALPPVAYFFDSCHSGVRGWQIIALTDCGMSPISFLVEGPLGDFDGANKVADALNDHINSADI